MSILPTWSDVDELRANISGYADEPIAVKKKVVRQDDRSVLQRQCMARLRAERRARGLNNMGTRQRDERFLNQKYR